MVWWRAGRILGGTVLVLATVGAFIAFDRNSHSASDTLRPLIITMAPIWLAAVVAARFVQSRTRDHQTEDR